MIYQPLQEIPGGQFSLNKNPPPTLGTFEEYYLSHFFKLCSEATSSSLPVTRVVLYQEQKGITDIRFEDIMLGLYSSMQKYTRDFAKKQQASNNRKK